MTPTTKNPFISRPSGGREKSGKNHYIFDIQTVNKGREQVGKGREILVGTGREGSGNWPGNSCWKGC